MISGISNTAGSAASASKGASNNSYLKQLQEKHPDLKLSAQSFANAGQLHSYAKSTPG